MPPLGPGFGRGAFPDRSDPVRRLNRRLHLEERNHAPSVFLAAALAVPVAAGAQSCAPRDDMIAHLSETYGESLMAGGVRDAQAMIEVWASPDGATWTLLLTYATGLSCIYAAGTDWVGAAPLPVGVPG